MGADRYLVRDSAGKQIRVGNRVRFRGEIYVIADFGPRTGRLNTWTIVFDRPPHVDEVPDEIGVDLVE